jgi:hypothetical protein
MLKGRDFALEITIFISQIKQRTETPVPSRHTEERTEQTITDNTTTSSPKRTSLTLPTSDRFVAVLNLNA